MFTSVLNDYYCCWNWTRILSQTLTWISRWVSAEDDRDSVVSCTASLYRWISLTWCQPPFGYSLSRILSREPPQHFSCVSAVFYKDGPLRLTSIFSRKSLFYYSLFPLRRYHRLIPIAEIWACFTPLPTLKTWTLFHLSSLACYWSSPQTFEPHYSAVHFS